MHSTPETPIRRLSPEICNNLDGRGHQDVVPLPPLTIVTQNCQGARGEFRRGGGPKLAMIRSLITKNTDVVALTETRATEQSLLKTKLKWGLQPSHYSVDPNARAGVVIYAKKDHKVMPNSKRTATVDGHLAAAVYNIHGSRVVIAAVYGRSENNDRVSNSLFQEVYNILRELTHIYQTNHIILLGDFNAVWRDTDANSFHSTKPRTTATLNRIIEKFQLEDLAVQTNMDKEHTWHRRGHSNQSSRIDYIFTNIPHQGAQMQQTTLTTVHTVFDHVWVQVTFGPAIEKKPPTMKDFILGSEEYIIKSTEYLEEIVTQYGRDTVERRVEDDQGDEEQEEEQEGQVVHNGDRGKVYTNADTGLTALHLFNRAVKKLQKLHNNISRTKSQEARKEIQTVSSQLASLKKQLKQQRTGEQMEEIHGQINEIQHKLSNDIEAKDKASQMRIQNFYRDGAGRMTPQSFYCVKEKRKPRKITKLEINEEEVTDENRIIQVMQEWYETTAMATTPQTMTLAQFLNKYDQQLPQLTEEQKDDLSKEFSIEEIHEAIQEACEVSAPGPSGQTIAFYKLIFSQAPALMTEALNQLVFQPELCQEEEFRWIKQRKVVYIPKNSDPKQPSDYRPLSMLETLYKIPSRILSRRVIRVLPTIIGQHQHGFMQGKGIQEPSLLMLHLIQDANVYNKPLQLISFDIEKAFDRISHEAIIQSLQEFGFPQEYVSAIHQYSLSGEAYVEVNGKKSDKITIKTGSGQGDPISSSLFDIGSEPLCLVLILISRLIAYRDRNNLMVGPTIFADDNMNPNSMTNPEQIQPILQVYADYKKVSGLSINTRKSTALCINTQENVIEGLRELGINVSGTVKHLGIQLGETVQSTIVQTLRQAETKMQLKRILATTPPSDLLHRAQLVNVAFTPILNHILMALPVPEEVLEELNDEVYRFLWTRQQDGLEVWKRRRVAKRRIPGNLHIGGLKIPTFQTLAAGFRLNLLQKIYKREKYPDRYPSSHLPSILQNLLRQTGRPSLQTHLHRLGTMEWQKTARALKPINLMFSMAFKAGGDMLGQYEGKKDNWHLTPIVGHQREGPFKLQLEEAQLLQQGEIIVVGQLFEENEAGQLRMPFNTGLAQTLAGHPNIIIKLQNLHQSIRTSRPHMVEKRVVPTSIMQILIQRDMNMSVINRKQDMDKVEETFEVAPAYQTRERDNVYVPDVPTFTAGYSVLKSSSLTSKTKEVVFEILNRTVWTNNKAFKTGLSDSPNCQMCGEQETMEHLLYGCPHYSEKLWAELSNAITQLTEIIKGNRIAGIHLTPREIIFNATHPSILLHYRNDEFQTIIGYLIQELKREIIYRRMNTTEVQRNRDTPIIRIQAHILVSIQKLISLLAYQGLLKNKIHIARLKQLREIIQDRVQ